ncbi:ABC transporter permease [Lactobacillus sp. S2-2]|uniref:ABC transporter permease n=1 Tax=Lactobacillus sp. S2-2 TaxID=2692917 RepID=UPI001F411BD9|nr:ABC transporter permease [Lactobacillus sp. S2-2]MCF6514634.1 ABC transporter permease [Lactobacillus sp. S2-2]
MNKLNVVISNTYKEQIKSKSFIIMILSPIIIVIIAGIIGYFVSTSSNSNDSSDKNDFKIAMITKNPELVKSFKQKYSSNVIKSIDTEIKAKKATKSGKIDGYLNVYTKNQQIKLKYSGNQQFDDELKKDLMISINQEQQKLNLKNSGINNRQINQLKIKPTYVSDYHESKHNQEKEDQKDMIIGANYIYMTILFFLTLTYSSIVATSIAKDKGSKTAEYILSSIDAFTYFSGKVIATILMLLTQIIIYIILGLVAYRVISEISSIGKIINENQHMINKVIENMFGFNLLYFILGAVIIILISAISGALVGKVEDSSKAAQPVSIFLLLCFYINIFLSNNSDALFFKIVSYIPVISTFTMNTRIANDNVTLIGILISLLISFVFIIICLYWVKLNYKGLLLKNDDSGFFKKIKNAVNYK